jgi:DNA-binding response OmpR family regulator
LWKRFSESIFSLFLNSIERYAVLQTKQAGGIVMTKVLLIESDIKTLLSLKLMLTYKGFNVTTASSVINAKNYLAKKSFQIIIAGIHRQDENMFEFVKSLRTVGNYVPVIYLGDRVYELEMKKKLSGLDDFITKPFTYSELTGSLTKAITKTHSSQKPLLYGNISMDENKKVLWVNEKIVPLAKMEIKILSLLAKKAGRIVTLEHLYSLYELDSSLNTRVFSYVANLRQKLEDAGVDCLKINFVRDGYKLEVV